MRVHLEWQMTLQTHNQPRAVYGVASKSSRNSLVKFTGIATVNKEMYVESFVALGVRSEGNAPKNG